MSIRTQIPTLAALATVALLLATGAQAIDFCKVKQSRKTGALEVSAREISGFVEFGYTSGNAYSSFWNEAECFQDGTAKRCQVADPTTPEGRVPPPFCEVYLRDDSSSCVAQLKRCTPGLRPVCPPDMEALGGDCVEKKVSGGVTFTSANLQCEARGRSLCSVDQLQRCDSLDLSKDQSASCGDWTDRGADEALWTSSSLPIGGSSIYSRLVVYGGDNEVATVSSSAGERHEYFCCTPLGAR